MSSATQTPIHPSRLETPTKRKYSPSILGFDVSPSPRKNLRGSQPTATSIPPSSNLLPPPPFGPITTAATIPPTTLLQAEERGQPSPALYEGFQIDHYNAPPPGSTCRGIQLAYPTMSLPDTILHQEVRAVMSNTQDYEEQPAQVPEEVLKAYYKGVQTLRYPLKTTENWYYITLRLYDSKWTIVVLVEDPETIVPPPMGSEHLTVEFWYGNFDTYSGVGVNFLYNPTVMSGVSVGENDPRQEDAGTLGGFIRGKDSGRIIGVTSGHLFFHSMRRDARDRPVHKKAPRTVIQPAVADAWDYTKDLQKRIENTIQRLNEPGLHARIKQQEEAELEALRSELQAGANSWGNEHHAFGSAVYAHWDTYLDDDPAMVKLWAEKSYRIKDIGFIVPTRQCSNRFPVPITERHFERVTGCSGERRYVIGEQVLKVGKETGCTVGTITSAQDVFYHSDLKSDVINNIVSNEDKVLCKKGDSGSFIVNTIGNVIGLAVGGCVGRSRDLKHGFFHLSFIPIEKVLKWAHEEFDEEFYVPSEKDLAESSVGGTDDEKGEVEVKETVQQEVEGTSGKEGGTVAGKELPLMSTTAALMSTPIEDEEDDGNVVKRPAVKHRRPRIW